MSQVDGNKNQTPPYLYKILSLESWITSQSQDCVELTKEDETFIHLATEEQLERIISKYWSHVPEYVLLKVDVDDLPGKLVYEANPGGTSKYYHLYEGEIPLRAISDAKLIKPKK